MLLCPLWSTLPLSLSTFPFEFLLIVWHLLIIDLMCFQHTGWYFQERWEDLIWDTRRVGGGWEGKQISYSYNITVTTRWCLLKVYIALTTIKLQHTTTIETWFQILVPLKKRLISQRAIKQPTTFWQNLRKMNASKVWNTLVTRPQINPVPH